MENRIHTNSVRLDFCYGDFLVFTGLLGRQVRSCRTKLRHFEVNSPVGSDHRIHLSTTPDPRNSANANKNPIAIIEPNTIGVKPIFVASQ